MKKNKFIYRLLVTLLIGVSQHSYAAADMDGDYSIGGWDPKFSVKYNEPTLSITDVNLGTTYKIDTSKPETLFLPGSDNMLKLKSNSSFAQRALEKIKIMNPKFVDNKFSAKFIYVINFDSNFGKFTSEISSDVEFKFKPDTNEVYVIYRKNLEILDLSIEVLGRNFNDSSFLSMSKALFGLIMDVALSTQGEKKKLYRKIVSQESSF